MNEKAAWRYMSGVLFVSYLCRPTRPWPKHVHVQNLIVM